MVIQQGTMESLEMNPAFWQNKRVLVTGHTGFKGGWASLMLSGFGAQVHGFSLEPPTSPCLYNVANVQSRMKSSTIADIRNYDEIASEVRTINPEVILHFAAQSLVHKSYDDPVGTYATNIMGTVNLLESARQLDGECAVINVTSDKCYENREWLWSYRENEPMGGYDPYSSSKGCSELVTAAYRNSFLADTGIKLASARAGNVIGGGDWAENRLVPDILSAYDNNKTLEIRNPVAIRPWQHVLEPVAGYLILAEKLSSDRKQYEGAWNFGPSEEDVRTVKWIAEQLHTCLSSKNGINTKEHVFHEAKLLKLDSSKAKMQLGWKPKWDVGTALQKTAEWHLAYRAGSDMLQVCNDQIASYLGQGE